MNLVYVSANGFMLTKIEKTTNNTMKTISSKMGVKEGMKSIMIKAPADAVRSIRHRKLKMASALRGSFDYIHFFTITQKELDRRFPALKKHLKPSGMLWISWPKAKQQQTDLTLTKIIKIGYDHGLVESKTLSIDSTWSAIKFTHPKKGKVYNNSYGKLK
jgi:hypothetical protein